MASVISLSSASLNASPKNTDSPVTVLTLSSEIHRVPVSWDGHKGAKRTSKVLDSDNTPNHYEKVKEWIDTTKYDDLGPPNENKSVCIRYDFDKSEKITINVPKSCFTRVTPLFSYMEQAKKAALSDEKKSQECTAKVNGNLNFETPLSPESQKKELCSYLQLMKPGEKKQKKLLFGNRRSKRVKNLVQNHQKTCSENDINTFPTLKSFEDLNIFESKKKKETPNKYLPLPPKSKFSEFVDFEDSVRKIVESVKLRSKVTKRRKFNWGLKSHQFNFKRINSLRSKGRLRFISLDRLILRKSRKRRKKFLKKDSPQKNACPHCDSVEKQQRCEIVSVHTNSDDENIDLKNFVDDMLELDKMSEEHRKSVIETRILASSSITNLINKQMAQEADVQKAYKIFADLSEKKTTEEKENKDLVTDFVLIEHDYAKIGELPSQVEEINELTHEESVKISEPSTEEDQESAKINELSTEEEDEESVQNSLSPVPIPDLEVLPVNTDIEIKSLHRSLTRTNRRKLFLNNYGLHNWNSGSHSDNRKLNHSISITKEDGAVLRGFYQDFNLVIVQEKSVSFWTQSALGNVLGAQNMWIPKGQIQRIPLNSTYVQKDANEMVISTETSVAYVELWTKEHKSDVREVPVADVFATVYFWRLRQSGLEKKALQLENIKGCAEDVRYCVLRCYPRIIVCWQLVQGNEKRTKIHSFHLAADFQTVANISEIQPVEHYVSSLHNIDDCDSLIMGCGESKITLWNIEYGYIVSSIELSNIKSPLATHWVKCDRGFLFMIQECADYELRLIAINGMNHSWKKLQNFDPPTGFEGLKGVCVENGIVIAYYSQGILCWNAQSGEPIVEEVPNECEYIPSGKHVILLIDENVIVRNSLSHLITDL
ncbi:uncharacterized protein LOC103314146 [Tribolium castaneum]|uniref:Uncharacterized protein n=1 Tax=Tribolium castaneum TaxID=7070 RepID=D6WV66_TRICA|nr:PREDICTED: uncharacterized protein LOC103314146 [Tribolium castaneum]EFA09082.1 hypothetical protein TcasGA2_TC006801 [Tribolium castaneum]|eukprot:XP_008197474.1 PREDICTED: uncharacterized protein LOC103314146 [Tribolium castaneum]